MTWRSLRVQYYDDLDRLVLGGIRPAVAQVRSGGDDVYFLRHWKNGQHVQLNIRVPEPGGEPVLESAREILERFLRDDPSRSTMSRERQVALGRRLRELENDEDVPDEIGPDNTVREARYRPPVASGHPDAAAFVERFYVDTTALALRMTERNRRPAFRLALAFDLMVAAAHTLSGMGLARGAISFRSHAEGFLCGYPEGRGLRSTWDAHHRRHADDLVARLRAKVAFLDGTVPEDQDPLLAKWVRTLASFRGEAAESAVDRTIFGWRGAAEIPVDSPFHRMLTAGDEWPEFARSRAFSLYRLVLNLTYLHLTRLGVAPSDRFLVCHLVAGAVEQHLGTAPAVLREAPARYGADPWIGDV